MPKPLRNDFKGLYEGFLYGAISTLSNKVKSPQRLLEEARREIEALDTNSIELSSERITSNELNKAIKAIYIWLSALYRGLLVEEAKTIKANQILESNLSNYEQAILKGLSDYKIIQLTKKYFDYNDARIVDFTDGRNRNFSGTRAKVSEKSNYLELNTLYEEKKFPPSLKGNSNIISVNYLNKDINVISNRYSGIERVVDSSTKTSWVSTILSDHLLNSTINSSSYYGAAVEITIDYMSLVLANEISIKPSSELKQRLINLEYSEDGSTWTQIPSFTEPTDLFWWVIKFKPTSYRYLKLTLLQENFKEVEYHLPYGVHINQQLLELLTTNDYLRSTVGSSEYEDRKAYKETKILLESIYLLDNKIKQIVKSNNSGDELSYITDLISPILDFFNIDSSNNLGLLARKNEGRKKNLVKINKYIYSFGIAHIESSYKSYFSSGTYISPEYSFNGSLKEVALTVNEDIPTIKDDLGNDINTCTIDYSIEISPDKKIAILPKDTSIVHEVIKIDPSTRKGYVRFNTSDSNPIVWKDNTVLDTSEYSFDPTNRELTLKSNKLFSKWSIYHIQYVPSSGQDSIDLISSFSPTKIPTPELFTGTDSSGVIKLTYPPFVDYSKINDTSLFSKEEGSSIFTYNSSIPQKIIDGEVWGIATSYITDNPLSDSATTINLSGNDGDYFVAPGTAFIGEEQISFTGKTSTTLTGVTRGINGTKASSHDQNTVITSVGKTVYEPITVFVDGVKAINRTDYIKGEHPVTVLGSNKSKLHSYIHVNNKLYFGSPIDNKKIIEVHYYTLAKYLRLIVDMKQTISGYRGYTPVLKEANLLINTSRI